MICQKSKFVRTNWGINKELNEENVNYLLKWGYRYLDIEINQKYIIIITIVTLDTIKHKT